MFDNSLTAHVSSKSKQFITFESMEKYVNTREFLRNYKELVKKNSVIVVTNKGKPEGVFTSYEKWGKKPRKRIKITTKILEKHAVAGGDPKMSQKIDEIVYKYPNPLKK